MSSEASWLCLRLEGPLQSWGFDSQYNRRSTGLMPTKSAIAGMCCAAAGVERGSEKETQILGQMASLRMTAIAIPRRVGKKTLDVKRLQDYHTIQGTRKAEGGIKDCHITDRHYLNDASFGVLLSGPSAICQQLASYLQNPVWGIWLGRKNCIPTSPVLVGVFVSQEDALKPLLGDAPLDAFTRQEDAATFCDGRDSLPDQARCFHSSKREFAPRRVLNLPGKP